MNKSKECCLQQQQQQLETNYTFFFAVIPCGSQPFDYKAPHCPTIFKAYIVLSFLKSSRGTQKSAEAF